MKIKECLFLELSKMGKTSGFIVCIAITLFLLHAKKCDFLENRDFRMEYNNYCKYVDSVGYKDGLNYIVIEANRNSDSIVFVMYLSGGAYVLLNKSNEIVNFYRCKNYEVLFIGDFPNEIVNVQKEKGLNIIDNIVKNRYPLDYKKYIKDNHSVGPLIFDYMNKVLIFKNDTLFNCVRQYY